MITVVVVVIVVVIHHGTHPVEEQLTIHAIITFASSIDKSVANNSSINIVIDNDSI